MARIPYPDEAELERKSWKGALNAGKMCAHMPDDFLAAWRSLSAVVLNNDSLDPMLRELAIVRIGHLSKAAYEVYYHAQFARSIGVSDEQLDALDKGDLRSPLFSPIEQAVLAFTDELVVNVRPSDEVLGELQRFLTTPQIFALIVSIGIYMTVARVCETTGVEIEPVRVFDPKDVAATDQAA